MQQYKARQGKAQLHCHQLSSMTESSSSCAGKEATQPPWQQWQVFVLSKAAWNSA
jgi:hypothetical protein